MTQVVRELWPIVHRLATGGEWPPRGRSEIDRFFAFANREHLLALLMADNELPTEVSAAKARFRAVEALYRKQYELSRNAILELQRVLGADSFLLLKGADYRHRLYARPELRTMVDLDIFVPSAQFPTMLAKLADAGYPRKYSVHGVGFAPGHHEVSIEIGHVHVEPHRTFAQRVRARIDYEGMWQRRERFESDGVSGNRLSPADAILGHAYKFALDEFSSPLIRYVDFYLLLQKYDDRLRECVTRARAWSIERPLFGALHLTSALFPDAGTPAVREAIDLLLDARTRRFLIERVLPDPATEPSGHVLGRRVQLWRKYALMDRSWRWIACFAYHVYETAIGSIYEWRARRSGLSFPPRSTTSAR